MTRIIDIADVRVGDKVRRTRTLFGVRVVQELTVSDVKKWARDVIELLAADGGAVGFYPTETEYTLELLERPITPAVYVRKRDGATWAVDNSGNILFTHPDSRTFAPRRATRGIDSLDRGVADGHLVKVEVEER